jgi:membrane-associated protease RseP (regulator of RpoE activity)
MSEQYTNRPEQQPYYTIPEQPKRQVFRFGGLPQNRPYINVLLLLATILSTYVTNGIWYSVAIITILLAHEMGHYLMCRRYGVPATLPFFIPFPLANPFGTMGAIIQMKGIIPSRRALFDIGVAGPLAGLLFAVPAIIIGLKFSQVVAVSDIGKSGMQLGESLLFKALSHWIVGPVPEGSDLLLDPVAYAGWAGLFVTSLNLLPIGQLDGGHIIYSILGARSRIVTHIFLAALGLLSIYYNGWALLFVLLALFGRRHPSPWDDWTPLDRRRKILGCIVMVLFVLSFTPTPFILD